jgi:magnesium transporter
MSRHRSRTAKHTQGVSTYLVTSVPIVRTGTTAGTAVEHLRDRRFECMDYIFVVDALGRLVGAAALADVLAASGESAVDVLAGPGLPVVSPDADREDAASLAIHSEAAGLAVCDRDGRLLGAVPAAALMSILRDEHLEDLHHMAGILSKSEAARRALSEPPHRRAIFRLPWLLAGMAGSAVATAVMAGYEKTLEANIEIAFFVPAIVYLADAVGTQSEAVAVRGLSLSSAKIVRLVLGEIGTGIIIGAVLAGLAFVGVWLGFGSARLAVAVALAIMAAGTVATFVGSFVPWVFGQLGYDPAYGSGPIGTVIQDVLSLVLYFWIAVILVV